MRKQLVEDHLTASQLFSYDVNEKKRIGINVYSKKGYKSKPVVKSYTKKEVEAMAGEVRSMNLKEVLSNEEFALLDKETKVLFLESWKKHYSFNQVASAFGGEQLLKFAYKQNRVNVDGFKINSKNGESKLIQVDSRNMTQQENESKEIALITKRRYESMSEHDKYTYLKYVKNEKKLQSLSKRWNTNKGYAGKELSRLTLMFEPLTSEQEKLFVSFDSFSSFSKKQKLEFLKEIIQKDFAAKQSAFWGKRVNYIRMLFTQLMEDLNEKIEIELGAKGSNDKKPELNQVLATSIESFGIIEDKVPQIPELTSSISMKNVSLTMATLIEKEVRSQNKEKRIQIELIPRGESVDLTINVMNS